MPGRGDATDEMTDAESFEPAWSPFATVSANWLKKDYAVRPEELLRRTQLMALTAKK